MDKPKEYIITNNDKARLITWCNERGYHISQHNHPKTKYNWNR